MWRFILKVIVFFTVLIGINTWSVSWMMPRGWQNQEYFNNLQQFKKAHQQETNTLFFGSSRTMRSIDPIAFDSLNALQTINTRSYLLTCNGVLHNELFYFIDQYFLEPSAYVNLRYLCIELDDEVSMLEVFHNTDRGAHYINPRNLPKLLRQISHTSMPFDDKLLHSYYFITMMIRHRLYMGQGISRLKHGFANRQENRQLTKSRRGYMPTHVRFPEYQHSPRLKNDHEKLMADTMQIYRNFSYIDSLRHVVTPELSNPLVLKTYLEFIEKMQSHGIHVICVLPLRRKVSPSTMSMSMLIPKAHLISMPAHPEISQLKHVKYWFDPGHLNFPGSVIYTRLFTQEFGRIVEEID